MASFDSGVEQSTESNDGSLGAKDNIPSLVDMMSTFSSVAQIKLPLHSNLPLGFGERYRMDQLRTTIRRRGILSRLAAGHKLRIAVSTNNTELVQHCLLSGVDPNSADGMARTPLHLACCGGYSDIVRLLLQNGANPNLKDLRGNTPLHLAASTNNIAVVSLLLEAGSDVKSNDLRGRNPLQLAQAKLKRLNVHFLYKTMENKCFMVDSPVRPNLETQFDIPVYDNSHVVKQALQVVEMMRLFLHRTGQDIEAELLNAFSTRLTLSETKEEVGTQINDVLRCLSGLSLHSMTGNQNTNCNGSFDNNINNSVALFSKSLPAPPNTSCSLISPASVFGTTNIFQNNQS